MLKKIALAATVALAASGAQAATLLGEGTYAVAGDTTRIQDGSTTLEFLDFSVTVDLSVTAALSTYGGDGFGVANETQISALFDAFGMTYAFSPGSGGVFDLTTAGFVTATQAGTFTGLLGITNGTNGALATYRDTTGSEPFQYFCVSTSYCGPDSFTYDFDFSEGDDTIGIALVRTTAAPIPLPAGLPLLIGGVASLAWLKRKRRA